MSICYICFLLFFVSLGLSLFIFFFLFHLYWIHGGWCVVELQMEPKKESSSDEHQMYNIYSYKIIILFLFDSSFYGLEKDFPSPPFMLVFLGKMNM